MLKPVYSVLRIEDVNAEKKELRMAKRELDKHRLAPRT